MIQNNGIPSQIQSSLAKKLWIGFKILILVLVGYFVWHKLKTEQDSLANVGKNLFEIWNINNWKILLIVLLLTAINWGFEALKWQILIQSIQKISFVDSLKSVLGGLTLGAISFAPVGDFIGKAVFLKAENRSKSVGPLLVSNGLQTFVTLLAGCLGFERFYQKFEPLLAWQHQTMRWLLILSILLLVLLWYFRKKILNRLSIAKLKNALIAVQSYSNQQLLFAFGAAGLRYFTFSCQFVLMLIISDINLPISDFLTVVSLVFLAKTVIPAFSFFSDLGIREMSALYFFSFWQVSPSAVLSATFSLWLVNILLPVLLGLGGILLSKFKF
jgi:uncharacterized membrane protein YbhN (UPF0104 family)